jgi:hypothetical protein
MRAFDRPPGLAVLLIFSASCLAAGCRLWGPPPLEHTQASLDALGQAVLVAYANRDTHALRALALSEEEFRDHVWPELPAARPERNLPFSYVWGDLRQKSAQSLARLLATHGGRAYTLVRVEHGRTTPYHSFVVHRETRLVVRTADGAERLQLFGSTLEKDGTFKVFSYNVDD